MAFRERSVLLAVGTGCLLAGAGVTALVLSGSDTAPAPPPSGHLAPVLEAPNPKLSIHCRRSAGQPVCRQGHGIRVRPVAAGERCRLAQDPPSAATGSWTALGPSGLVCQGADGRSCAVVAQSTGAVFTGRWRDQVCHLPRVPHAPCAMTSSGQATDPPPPLGVWVALVYTTPTGKQQSYRCQ